MLSAGRKEGAVDRGVVVERTRSAPSTYAALAAVSANGGVSFVPAWVCAVNWSGLVFRHVENLNASIDLAIAWRTDRKDLTLTKFVEAASRQAAKRR